MKTLHLPLQKLQPQTEMLAMLQEAEFEKGDRLDVILDKQNSKMEVLAILLLIGLLLFAYFAEKRKEKRIDEGDAILKDLFARGTPEELEKEIEAEYGVQIELITGYRDEEDAELHSLAMLNLASAYDPEEQDYGGAVLLESNPDYKSA